MRRLLYGLAALALLLGGSAPARAGLLLTSSGQAQIEGWLGEGRLTLTNVFTKVAGDGQTSADFRAAADGTGQTIVLCDLMAADGHAHQVIGGYNPRGWDSPIRDQSTPGGANRTAFLFNLTTSTVLRQKPGTDLLVGSGVGQIQTFNYGALGGGHDLYADFSLGGLSILGELWRCRTDIVLDRLEVYTVADVTTAVPVPPALALAGTGLASLAGYGWRRRKAGAAA